jgi:hypothetical protein
MRTHVAPRRKRHRSRSRSEIRFALFLISAFVLLVLLAFGVFVYEDEKEWLKNKSEEHSSQITGQLPKMQPTPDFCLPTSSTCIA